MITNAIFSTDSPYYCSAENFEAVGWIENLRIVLLIAIVYVYHIYSCDTYSLLFLPLFCV